MVLVSQYMSHELFTEFLHRMQDIVLYYFHSIIHINLYVQCTIFQISFNGYYAPMRAGA